MKPKPPKIPNYLTEPTRKWCREILSTWQLEPHHLRTLFAAAKSYDRATEARIILDKAGLTFEDRFGQVRPRPETTIERDSLMLFAKLMRELNLDCEVPPELPKPPKIRG